MYNIITKFFEFNISTYRDYESDGFERLNIDEYLKIIGFDYDDISYIMDWLKVDNSGLNLYTLSNPMNKMIPAVTIGKDAIYINYRHPMLSQGKLNGLFLLLHESRHTHQMRDDFTKGDLHLEYFMPVVNDDFNSFVDGYTKLERDANDYAINSIKELKDHINIGYFNDGILDRFRMNENAASMVFKMMKKDISNVVNRGIEVNDFYDLIKFQLLG